MEHCCTCCKTMFRRDRFHPDQRYCPKEACQRQRRANWQKSKLKTDPSYRENQADAQADWRAKNPDYWRNYRATHPEYVERNRQMQQERRKRKKATIAPLQPDVAKMDVASLQNPIPSGRYRLFSLDSNDIAKDVAKMNFAIVELSIIESVTATG